jgi:hypothetical protein
MEKEVKNPEKPKKKGLNAQAIVSIIIIVLMIIIPLFVYLWKQSEIKNLKEKYDKDIAGITAKANSTIDENNKKNIEQLTRVFSWAVRSEMLRNNMEQVDNYMTDLVKTADLNNISAVKTDGIVVLSTDKKFEGNIYPGPIANELAQINQTVSRTGENGDIISICPIMGIDNRIGTLIITYTPKKNIFVAEEKK